MNIVVSRCLLALVLFAVVACGEQTASNATPATASGNASPAPGPSPCSLLTADEVAAVMGALAGPGFRADNGGPRVDGDQCRYESKDLRSLALTYAASGATDSMKGMSIAQGVLNDTGLGELKLVDGSPLVGHWDEARVFGCCEFHARHGEQMVTIDVAGTGATLAQAGLLADAALQRLARPLDVDDAAAVAAAQARKAERPTRRSACELVTRADAEAALQTKLPADPVPANDSCVYRIPAGYGDEMVERTLVVQWRDGFRALAMLQFVVSGTGSQNSGANDASAKSIAAQEERWESIAGVMAVKRDVLISIETDPFGADAARALVSKAIENLDRS